LILLLALISLKQTNIVALGATDFDQNGVSYISYQGDTCWAVASVSQTVEVLTLPTKHSEGSDKRDVYHITPYAFQNATKLRVLNIPASVISDGGLYYLFNYCASLERISIIGNHSEWFTIDGVLHNNIAGQKSLSHYPAKKYGRVYTVDSTIDNIDGSAFSNNEYLEEINIPANIGLLDATTFKSCKSLKTINVDENNDTYSSYRGVLMNKNKTTLIHYPVDKKEDAIFWSNTQATGISSYAFSNNKHITSIDLSNCSAFIDNKAFKDCTNLKNVILSNNLKFLQESVFEGCTSLEYITLPTSLTNIVSKAFKGSGLKYIEIPASVTSTIGNNVFEDCVKLNSITFKCNKVKIRSETFLNSGIANNSNTKIFVPESQVDAYKTDASWDSLKNQIFLDPTTYNTFNTDGGFFTGYIPHSPTEFSLEPPVKLGNSFNGWQIQGEGISYYPILTGGSTTGKTYTVLWDNYSYNIIYNLGAENVNNMDNPTFYTNNTSTQIANPTRDGYIFLGWTGTGLEEPTKNLVLPSGTSYGHKEFTANWEPRTDIDYNIHYYLEKMAEGEYELYAGLVEKGTMGETITLTNYENKYEGFDFHLASSTITGIVGTGTNTLTLKAYYKRKSYNVIWGYNHNGVGNHFQVDTVKYDNSIEEPEGLPGKLDDLLYSYIFESWDRNIPITMPAHDIVFKAIFAETPIKYWVHFYDWDGITCLHSMYTEYCGAGIPPEKPPTRTGYIFRGWDKTFDVITVNNYKVVARYTPIKYTIKFNSNGGSDVSDITQNYESDLTIPTNVTKTGYTFDNWYTDETLTTAFDLTKMPLNGATLYAKWTPNPNTSYKIEYYQQNIDNDEYTLTETDNTKFGTTGNTITLEGYINKFNGFTYTPQNSIISGEITGDGLLVLKVYYTRKLYTITFLNGDDVFNQQVLKYEKAVATPEEPSKPATDEFSYRFKCWGDGVPDIATDNEVISAVYTPVSNKYSVVFKNKSGGTITTIQVDYGKNVIPPTAPEVVGYTFEKWDTDLTNIKKNITATAVYKPKEYTISFNSGEGGSEVASVVEKYTNRIVLPEAPTRAGYKFIGWYNGDNKVENGDILSNPEDISLVARWEEMEASDSQSSAAKPNSVWYIVLSVVGGIEIILGIYFIVRFIKGRKSE